MTTTTRDHHPAQDEQPIEPWEATAEERAAEAAVIGCMLTPLHITGRDGPEVLSSPAIIDIRRVLRPEHFYTAAHQAIARTVYELADAGVKGIDPLVVADALTEAGVLAVTGGITALTRYPRMVPTTTNAAWYADRVREGADRRATYAYSARVAQYAAAVDGDRLNELVAAAHADYLTSTAVFTNDDLPSVGNQPDEIAGLLQRWGQADETGATTGLRDLDDRLNVSDGALVVVAGRPGSGKSLLGAQWAWHYVSQRGEGALCFSAEMTRLELMERDIARIAGVRLDSSSGKTPLTVEDSRRLMKASAEYERLGTLLWYDDTPTLTVAHIRARYAEVAAAAGAPKLVVIDYLQLMQMPKADRRDLAIAEVTRQLKVFAQESQCLVVLLCQLNRGPESRPDGRPMLSDLRESGAIEQDCDVAFLLHDVGRYQEDRQGSLDLIIAKQRKGGHGITITLSDRRAYAELGNWSRQDPPSPAAAGAGTMPDLDDLTGGGDGGSADRNGDGWWNKG